MPTGLTNALADAFHNRLGVRAVALSAWPWLLVFLESAALVVAAYGANPATRSVTIHWQQVPLGDAVARLETSFGETVFIDRRVDRSQRVSVDIEASSMEEALTPIAEPLKLGTSGLGRLVYLGPEAAAQQLAAVAAARRNDLARLPVGQRASLVRRRRIAWPRRTEPRGLIVSLVEQHGWRVAHAEQIPHDLWPAGTLPELALAEQLTVLLTGFDLTFEIRPRERALAIVPLEKIQAKNLSQNRLGEGDSPIFPRRLGKIGTVPDGSGIGSKPQAAVRPPAAPSRVVRRSREARQVYTLRVEEQPVRAVLRELSQRLGWQIEIDEAAVRAADVSLDRRISFTVENVGQGELLEALLQPAGLAFRREGERILIVPGDDI